MAKAIFMAIIAVAMFTAGCATVQTGEKQCGSFDTDLLRTDLKTPFRTDMEWYEAIIKRLAWQLDCERSQARPDTEFGR